MFFLYHRTTRPTGEVLGDCLGVPHGVEPPSDRQDVLIRWGSQARSIYRPELTINPAFAIQRATDKYESLEIMRGRGVVVPDFSRNPATLVAPFLGRNNSHTRGLDIKLCLQQSDAVTAGSDFYTKYIPVDREYRVRVVGDECVRISQKVFTGDSRDYCAWIRNYQTGHTFVSPRTRLNDFQEALAVAAVKVHGLHFGAVDMVVGDDGNTYVLEVNTAPALAPRSAGAMLGGLVRLVEAKAGITLDPDFGVLERLSNRDDGVDDGDTEDDTDGLFDA